MRSAALLVFMLSSCVAGLVPPPAPPVHWFSLDRGLGANVIGHSPTKITVHVQPVEAAAHLSDRLVQRISDVEFTVHEDTHWVEAPSRVLERQLRRVLFEERGFIADPLGDSLVLACELVSLEEDRRSAPVARAILHLELSRGHRMVRAKTIQQTVSISGPSVEATALALAKVLEKSIAATADWILEAR